jgi:hypothetical protein
VLIFTLALEPVPQIVVAVWVFAVPPFQFLADPRPIGSVDSIHELKDTLAAVRLTRAVGSFELIEQLALRSASHARKSYRLMCIGQPFNTPAGTGGLCAA